MAVQVKARLNGGAWNTGGITAALNDVVELQWVDATGITVSKWEIVDYPVGFALPAGWALDSLDSYTYYSLSPVPPSFTMTPWGKFMVRGTANGGLAIQPDGSLAASTDLVDIGTALSVPSAVAALEDTGSIETTQFHDNGFVASLKINWRLLEALVGAGVLPGADHTLFYSHGGAAMWTGAPEVPSVTATSFFLSPAGYIGVGVALPPAGAIRLDNALALTSADPIGGATRNLIRLDATGAVQVGDAASIANITGQAVNLNSTAIVFNDNADPATTGVGRWCNNAMQYWRTNAGANACGIGLDASNAFQLGNAGYNICINGLAFFTNALVCFDSAVANPIFAHYIKASGAGTDFTIRAQASGDDAGGDLLLQGGNGFTTNGDVVLHHGVTERHRCALGYDEISPVAAHATADPATNLLEWYYASQGWGAGPDVRHIVVPASTYAVGAATDAQHCKFECWYDFHTAAMGIINIDFEVAAIAGRTYTGAARDCVIWYKVTANGFDRNDGATTRGVWYFEGSLQYTVLTSALDRMVTGGIIDFGDTGGPGTFSATDPPNNHTFRVEFNPSDANDVDWTFHVEMTLWNPGSP